MNASGMGDEAIYAFNPVPPPAAPPRPPRRARWPWVLGAVLLLALAGTVAASLALWTGAREAADAVQVVIDGEPWGWGLGDGVLRLLGAVFALGVVLMVVMVVVPCVLALVALVMLAVLVSVGLALGGVLLALAAVAAVLLSPLWLAVALLWWLLRPRARPAATMAP